MAYRQGKEDNDMARRIVLLEDDENIQELFSIMLHEQGFQVHLYNQVFADFSEVERLAPDLMIIDVFMGTRQEGWELMQRLKAHPATAPIPLLLSTAGKLTGEQEHIARSQGITILYKPFEFDELVQLVYYLTGSTYLL
jgi:DNA-binding response OmpR family regulator